MKKYYSILMAAVLVGLAACAKQEAQIDTPEDTSEIVAEDLVVFTATDGEAKTKSEIDGSTGKFTWNTTDRIAVHTTAGYKLSATAVVDGEDPGLATFTVDKGGAAINGFALSPYTLVYDDLSTVNTESAAKWGNGGGDLVVNLPGTYTLADIAGDKSPIPAIAVNEDGDLHFKQLGALLRVTLNNLPPSTRSVTIDFNGKKVQGAFTISSPTPGTSQIATSATDGSDDTITINTPDISAWTDGQVVNIPVPIGEYTTITVTSWDAADGADGDGNATLTMTRYIKVVNGVASNWTPSRRGARKVIASLPAFSVDAEHRVAFAPGNLYKDNGTWKFFDEEYGSTFYNLEKTFNQEYYESQSWTVADTDISTEEKKSENNPKLLAASDWAKTKYSGLAVKDLFTWDELTTESTGVAGPTYVVNKTTIYTTIYGTVNVGSQNDRDGVLRSDWKLCPDYRYMMTSRDGAIYARALLMTSEGFPNYSFFEPNGNLNAVFQYEDKLGGTSGIFIFPDHWDVNLLTSSLQLGLNQSSATSKSPSYTLYTWQTEDYIEEEIYTTKEPRTFLRTEKFYKVQSTEISRTVYDQLIAAGATFLPCSGMGSAGTNDGVTPRRIGELGGCWTSAKTSETKAYYFQFLSRSVGTTMGNYSTSLSVRSTRLVRDIN